MSNTSTRADDILRCARSLIVRGGYNSFSYADISKVVGIRTASIHHHFPGKADLVRVLVVQYRQEVEAGLAELERNVADPVEQLRAYLGYWEGCFTDMDDPFCVCALLAGEAPVLPEAVALEVRAHFRNLAEWLTTVFERGAAEGRLRLAGTARVEAELFMAGVHGAMLSARAYGDATTFAAIARPLLERVSA
ncbi:TetR/AcrR family transcriptional regulator [Azospirillum sp. YIM B02556]|uniref:TetR/AcrR family transcriptional regulator n=1 Tax=Azospirillum endophyticum TaxID=2800326 RepID=A0ABS1FB21_9PROT|nr:TetR/AcrR family transcriptional regulator [Azospirillum endophyticum]MBK1840620.1 TetR/AcrR family transcriptional regulator [Azospirillum endophyticum]